MKLRSFCLHLFKFNGHMFTVIQVLACGSKIRDVRRIVNKIEVPGKTTKIAKEYQFT